MTPLPTHMKLIKPDCPQSDEKRAKMDKLSYVFACRILMYAMIATQLDIEFARGVVIYMSNLSKNNGRQ